MTQSSQAFGQVLWVDKKGPRSYSISGFSKGDFIIHMANKEAEEQVWQKTIRIYQILFLMQFIHLL